MVKVLSRDAVQRMTGRKSSSAVNIGGGSGDGSGVSRAWVEENYISKAFFETLFTIHGTKEEDGVTTDVVITPNDTETTLKNIQAMVGLWTNSYLSALGLNPGGGGGGGATALTELVDVNISNPQNGQALIYNSTAGKWVNGQAAAGSVTSVAMSVPTGFSINGSPITTSGTLALSFASGYSLPTTAKQTQWDAKQDAINDLATIRSNASHGETAYNWGNHANADYATRQWVQQGYLPLTGGTMANTNKVTNLNADLLDGYHVKDAERGLNGNLLYKNHKEIIVPAGGGYVAVAKNIGVPFMFGYFMDADENPAGAVVSINCYSWSSYIQINVHRSTGYSNTKISDIIVTNGTNGYFNVYLKVNNNTQAAIEILSEIDISGDVEDTVTPIEALDLSGTWGFASNYGFKGNASTATKLQTARTIWGQNFDGTGNVSGAITGATTISASSNVSVGGTLSVTGVTTLSSTLVVTGLLTANGGITIPIGKTLTIGDAVLSWDSTNQGIKITKGLYSETFISALGANSSGGGGGATALTELVDVTISNPQNGQALIYNSTAGKWVNGQAAAGSVTSVAMSVPTGFAISGSPITTSGTLVLSFASGYSLPTTAKQTQWDAAYSWGNHATAGYAKVSETMVLVNHGMSTIDADTIKTAGSHRLSNSGTNFPAGPDWGQMLVVHGGGDTYAQMYFPYSESAIYFRNGNPDSRTGSWREWKRILTAGDAVTSVAMSVPTGFSISGSPITTSGTLAISFASGYSLPTTAKQTQWDAKQDAISDLATIRSNAAHGETAYNWGNHATAGYATKTWVQQGYLPLTGGTMSNTNLVVNLNADMLDGRHGDGYAVIGVMGTRIEQETDLNDILNAGTYTCISRSDALTLDNTPYTGGNFRLWHIVNTGTDGNTGQQWSSQIMLAPNEARMFIRSHNTSSFGSWKEFAYLTSNVASATKLQTARTIWGQNFDGTGNVSGDITDAGNIFAKGDYLLLSSGKSKYGLMVESTSWGENRDCAFGFHAATSGHDIAWSTRSGQNDICLDLVIDPNNTVAKRYTRVYDALCIGDGMIIWDSANNALKVIKMNGDAANFYATGGVSALGAST